MKNLSLALMLLVLSSLAYADENYHDDKKDGDQNYYLSKYLGGMMDLNCLPKRPSRLEYRICAISKKSTNSDKEALQAMNHIVKSEDRIKIGELADAIYLARMSDSHHDRRLAEEFDRRLRAQKSSLGQALYIIELDSAKTRFAVEVGVLGAIEAIKYKSHQISEMNTSTSDQSSKLKAFQSVLDTEQKNISLRDK